MTVAGQMAEYGHLRMAVSGCGRLIHPANYSWRAVL